MKKGLAIATVLLAAMLPALAQNQPNDVRTFTVKGVSFKMVYVNGGTFSMGATKEQG